MRPPFFVLCPHRRENIFSVAPPHQPNKRPLFLPAPPHPGCSGILSTTRSGTNTPHTQTVAYPTTRASNTRLPHDLLSGAQTNRPHTPPAAPPRAPTLPPAPGKSTGARHTQSGTSRSAHQPPDHGGRHLRGLRFLSSARTGTPAAPKPTQFIPLLRRTPPAQPPHTQTVAYPTTQASNTRLPHDLLSGAQTNRPHTPPAAPPRAPTHPPAPGKRAEVQQPHTHPARRPSLPTSSRPGKHKKNASLAGTATLHPHPRPRHPPPEPAGKKHPLPAPPSTPAPPGKAPSRTPSQTPLRTHTRRERAPEPVPHIRIRSTRASSRPVRHKKNAALAGTATLHPHPQHSTPAPSAPLRAGREKAPSFCPAINARAALRLPAPPPPTGTKKAAAR